MNTQWFVVYALMGVLSQSVPAFSQEAILPQGDPQGKSQGGSGAATAGDPNGLSRQQTGLSDPSVNPGQASGMRVLRGEVKQAGIKTIVIEDRNGKEATMSIDAATAGDRDIRPGDVITGTVTPQGRAVAIHKETGAER